MNDEKSGNLAELINGAVAARLQGEFVEQQVTARVDKLVVDAIDNALRSYSDVGKMIEQAVKDALRVDRLDLPNYGMMVTEMVKRQIELRASEVVAGRLEQDIEDLLRLAPKEIKLSKIAEQMLEQSDVDYGDAITVIVERNDRYSSVWLYLDPEKHRSDRDKYRCKHRLHLSEDGTIHGAYLGEDKYDIRKNYIGRAYGLEQSIRAWVACGTRIELDEDFVVIGKGDY